MKARQLGVLKRALVLAPVVLLVAMLGPARAGGQAPDPGRATPPRPILHVSATVSPDQDLVKYYVVGEPVDGQREYLFAIAVKTLGDGRRFPEIFDLNVGRRQRDGGRLTDAYVLEPGWVLFLPDDAAGPGVLVGRRSSFIVDGTETTGSSTRGFTDSSSNPANDDLLRGIALLATVALLALALRLLRRGTPLALRRPAWTHPDAIRAITAGVTRDVAASPRLRALASRMLPSARPAQAPAPAVAKADLTALHAEVRAGEDAVLTVQLTGERATGGSPGFGWIQPGDPRPSGSAVLILGAGRDGELWLDLAACPDVLTVTGHAGSGMRQVREWARQLGAIGVPVAIVLDGSESTLPPGCRAVRGLAHLLDHSNPPAVDLEIVFCAAQDATDPLLRERLLSHLAPRWILVLVGDVRRSRWSVAVSSGLTGTAGTLSRQGPSRS